MGKYIGDLVLRGEKGQVLPKATRHNSVAISKYREVRLVSDSAWMTGGTEILIVMETNEQAEYFAKHFKPGVMHRFCEGMSDDVKEYNVIHVGGPEQDEYYCDQITKR